jgi:hypothetical protein
MIYCVIQRPMVKLHEAVEEIIRSRKYVLFTTISELQRFKLLVLIMLYVCVVESSYGQKK